MYVMVGILQLAYFGGIFIATLMKMELIFHHNQVSLAIMGFSMPLKKYFLEYCDKHDMRVIKDPETQTQTDAEKKEEKK